MREIRVVAAIIEQDGRFLITQRRPEAVLPMLWEFPGGRVEEGEADEEALAREVNERLGVTITIREKLSSQEHKYAHYSVTLVIFNASITSGEIKAQHVHDFRWVKSEEFDNYDFPPADQSTMDKLLGLSSDDNKN